MSERELNEIVTLLCIKQKTNKQQPKKETRFFPFCFLAMKTKTIDCVEPYLFGEKNLIKLFICFFFFWFR